MRRLFSDAADLTGVTGGREGLKVDAAVHKAVLTLDEAGLEGAAATAMTMTRLAAITSPPRPIPVRVDRPFYLLDPPPPDRHPPLPHPGDRPPLSGRSTAGRPAYGARPRVGGCGSGCGWSWI